jgi:hypothetical protein
MNYFTRDRHRYVISRKFDYAEAMKRVKYDSNNDAKDDNNFLLKNEAGTFAFLEITHILSHSLMFNDG